MRGLTSSVQRQRRWLMFGAIAVLAAGSVVAARAPEAALAASTSLSAAADSYVTSSSTKANFGTASTVSFSASTYRGLMRFDTSAVTAGSVTGASLRLYSPAKQSSGGIEVHPEGNGWTETGITWSSQPVWSNAVVATSPAPVTVGWLTIALPASAITAGGQTNFGYRFTTAGIVMKVASREDAQHAPQLMIIAAASPTPTPTSTPTSTPTPTPTSTPTSTPTPTPTPTPTSTPVAGMCGSNSGASTITKSLVIWFENRDYNSIIGSANTPYLTSVANSCGVATNYSSFTHPSLPNYLTATSGLPYAFSPWTSDCSPSSPSCRTANPSIFEQIGASRWKGYAETMPTNCDLSGSGSYAPRHNPATYYPNISAACATNDVPLGSLAGGAFHTDLAAGALPDYGYITPNLLDDMHDGTVAAGDAWISQWLPQIVAGSDYQSGRLAIFLAWDEGSGSGTVTSHVANIVVSPFTTPGTTSATAFNHNSLLRTTDEIAGLPVLGDAATANSMRSDFGL